MQTSRETLTVAMWRLGAIKTSVYETACYLNEHGDPGDVTDLLEVYQSLSAMYGRLNRRLAGTPAERPHTR